MNLYTILWWLSVLQATLMNGMHYYGILEFPPSLLYAAAANALASTVRSLEYPSRAHANHMYLGIQWLTFACFAHCLWTAAFTGIFQGWFPEAGRTFFLTVACHSHSRTLRGPGPNDVTFDVWTSGRWCKTRDQQVETVSRAMRRHRWSFNNNEEERCFTTCVYQPPPADVRWHGYVSSAPAGQLPGKEYCPHTAYFGNCPETELYSSAEMVISFIEVVAPGEAPEEVTVL